EIALRVAVALLLAGDDERVLLNDDRHVIRGEARDRHRDAIAVVAGLLDVVRRIAAVLVAEGGLHQPRQAVEADGRTEQGGKIELGHSQSPPMSNSGLRGAARHGPAPTVAGGPLYGAPARTSGGGEPGTRIQGVLGLTK